MRPVCWSQSSADEGGVLRDAEREAVRALPEATPTEEPGVFVEQPYERWSPREVPMGADASQLFLFQHREKWAPSGPPPGALAH